MNTLDSLGILEEQISKIIRKLQLVNEDRQKYKRMFEEERTKNIHLSKQLESMQKELNQFNQAKDSIRSRIENLIKKLSSGDDGIGLAPEEERHLSVFSKSLYSKETSEIEEIEDPLEEEEQMEDDTIDFYIEDELEPAGASNHQKNHIF